MVLCDGYLLSHFLLNCFLYSLAFPQAKCLLLYIFKFYCGYYIWVFGSVYLFIYFSIVLPNFYGHFTLFQCTIMSMVYLCSFLLFFICPDTRTGKSIESAVRGWLPKPSNHPHIVEYAADFMVQSDFGRPGAIIITNLHNKEFYLMEVVIHGFKEGPIFFPANSWIHSRNDNRESRIIFSNQVRIMRTSILNIWKVFWQGIAYFVGWVIAIFKMQLVIQIIVQMLAHSYLVWSLINLHSSLQFVILELAWQEDWMEQDSA